jgi:hypothetical protein
LNLNTIARRIVAVATLMYLLAAAAFGDTITGRLYEDTNGNGKRDTFEMFFGGRTVFLGSLTIDLKFGARTDDRGRFTIANVPEGRFRLSLEPMGDEVTQPPAGKYDVIVPGPAREYNFGVHERCIEYGKTATVLQPTSVAGCFNWDFTFTNVTDAPMSDVYFDLMAPLMVYPRNNSLSWNHVALPAPLGPGKTTTLRLTICGLKPGDCVKVPFFILQSDGMCCQTDVEICAPVDQCIGIRDNKIKCKPDGSYLWDLSFQNLTGTTVTKVALSGIRSSTGVLLGTPSPSFWNGLSIPNNAIYNLPLINLPVMPGSTLVRIDIVLYDSKGECCRYTIETRLPYCDVDGHCELCPENKELIGIKPSFAEAKIAEGGPTGGPDPSRIWNNYKGLVGARTFTFVPGSANPKKNDLYALSYINLLPATFPSPTLGQHVVGSLYESEYHGPPDPNDPATDMWKHAYLGTIFGLTIDSHGNTYVAHFGMYPNWVQAGKDPFSGTPWRFGSILKIDGLTGKISEFARLPNDQTSMPGLGNITFDYDHNLIFAVNMEDGLIYRMNMSGNTAGVWAPTDTYGPFTNEQPGHENGMVKSEARIFAIQYHCGRLYFSRFADYYQSPLTAEENLIYSIRLDANGNFVGGPPKYEAGLSTPTSNVSIHRDPVSDISFSPEGRMGVAEMSIDYDAYASQKYRQGAHHSRAWEYNCGEKEMWEASDRFYVGRSGLDTAGGLDYDYNTVNVDGKGYLARVWWTGTALNPSFAPGFISIVTGITGQKCAYGVAGFDPTPYVGGFSYYGPKTYTDSTFNVNLPGQAIIIDYNGDGDTNWYSKKRFGDFEVPFIRG